MVIKTDIIEERKEKAMKPMYEKQVDEILNTRVQILISFYWEDDNEKKNIQTREKLWSVLL